MSAFQEAIEKSHALEAARKEAQEAERIKLFQAQQERIQLDNLARQKMEAEKPIIKTPFQVIGKSFGVIVAARKDNHGNVLEMFVRSNGRSIMLEPCEENFIG
jgi:hypothetical protein